jgi:hypothetical protein
MTPLERAQAFLEDIAGIQARVRALEEQAEKEIRKIEERFRPLIEEQRGWLLQVEKDLLSLMKKEKAAVFADGDKVSLPCGLLLRAIEDKLKLPRDALDRVEEMGWLEAVRITKSLDRGVVASWPIERIAAIGGDRRKIEVFKYEVRPSCGGSL